MEPANCVDAESQTPLHLAAYHGKMQAALHLLAAGALMDRDDYGRAPLHMSVIAGWVNMTNLLMDSGAYVELYDNNRRTPLHLAAFYGHVPLIDLLLTRKADIDALDGDLNTPLHYTAKWDPFIEGTKTLTSRGATLQPKNIIGFTPLHYACHANQKNNVDLLLDLGADIYIMDEQGWNPLVHAAAEGHAKMVDDLLVRVLIPKSYPTPDPAGFTTQNIGNTIIGMPAYAFAIVVTCICSSFIVCPAMIFMRHFNNLRKPYICDTSDATIEEFVNEVWNEVSTSHSRQHNICKEWDRLPTHTLKDLHRVK